MGLPSFLTLWLGGGCDAAHDGVGKGHSVYVLTHRTIDRHAAPSSHDCLAEDGKARADSILLDLIRTPMLVWCWIYWPSYERGS